MADDQTTSTIGSGAEAAVGRPGITRVAPRPFGTLRRAATVAAIHLARRLVPALVALAGERCWDCGKRITPTVKLPTYHIVEARLWAWEEVLCDTCVRSRLRRFGGLGPRH